MARDLGNKHVCFKCGTKFYDLKKAAPVCPKCGADQREAPVAKPASSSRRAPAPAPAREEEEAEAAGSEDEEADAGEEAEEEPADDKEE
jgi:uncharacterized protein (TIGR02300 family)